MARLDNMLLVKPDAPSLRVLEGLMPSYTAAPGRRRVEETTRAAPSDVDEFLDKSKGIVRKAKGGRKQKVTAEMKRAARAERATKREDTANANKVEMEEIFEVGEEGMDLETLAEMLQVCLGCQACYWRCAQLL